MLDTKVIVKISIYHLSRHVVWLNSAMAPVGAWHTGVVLQETNKETGVEVFYWKALSGTGIDFCLPGQYPGANCVHMGNKDVGLINTSLVEVLTMLEDLKPRWLSHEYHVLRHNCNHFSAFVLQMLGLALPGYINRLATIGCALARPFVFSKGLLKKKKHKASHSLGDSRTLSSPKTRRYPRCKWGSLASGVQRSRTVRSGQLTQGISPRSNSDTCKTSRLVEGDPIATSLPNRQSPQQWRTASSSGVSSISTCSDCDSEAPAAQQENGPFQMTCEPPETLTQVEDLMSHLGLGQAGQLVLVNNSYRYVQDTSTSRESCLKQGNTTTTNVQDESSSTGRGMATKPQTSAESQLVRQNCAQSLPSPRATTSSDDTVNQQVPACRLAPQGSGRNLLGSPCPWASPAQVTMNVGGEGQEVLGRDDISLCCFRRHVVSRRRTGETSA